MKTRSLGARLVAAMVLLSVLVLALGYATTYLLVRRELQENALDNLRSRTDDLRPAVASLVAASPRPDARLGSRLRGLRADLRAGLKITDLRAVFVGPGGAVHDAGVAPTFTVPDALRGHSLDTDRLLAGDDVSGRVGNTVYLAIPARLFGRQRLVVIATDHVETKVLSRTTPLLIVAGVVVLLLAAGAAMWLARRLTRPIREIERAATQLASGDLSGRAELPPSTDADLAALGDTLNAMAAQLEASRGSQRAFLLSISHDLRTPLTSIRGYAEALADGTLDDADPEARKRAATVIGAEARRLERLVRDLLDLSRLDSREFSFRPAACDASEVVRDAAEAFAPGARELGVALVVQAGAAAPATLDADRVGQIVANLVENALKYARARVDVVSELRSTELSIVVTDDGPGIPATELTDVFTRLYTARGTPGRAVGTGLGLAIVQELAAAMGGRAWAESPDGGGARLVVTVPIARNEAARI
jgi:two-component system sensor histidine kinase BaeS